MNRVLLVDDKEENLEYLAVLLKGNGFDVECAQNGADALDKGRQHPPNIIISDLLMPVMDGYTLLRHWKKDPVLKSTPFIVYTATYTEPADEQLALDLGADAFMLKPEEPEGMMQRIQEVLGRPLAARDTGAATALEQTVLLSQYNDALIRKLEHKTRQLEDSNRALLLQISDRDELAQVQIAILNALPAQVGLIDSDGIIVAVNDSWQSFAAAAGETVARALAVGQNYLQAWESILADRSAESARISAALRAALRGASSDFSVEHVCHSSAEQHWCRMTITSVRTGRAGGAVVMHVDVSDIKAIEQRLRESEGQYLMLLNSTAEGIYGIDINGVCTFCNPAAARFLGFDDPQELVGRLAHERHHHSRADGTPLRAEECAVHGAFLGGRAANGDGEVFFRKDGSQFPVQYWSHPIRRGVEVIGAVIAFLDVSERKNLEAQFLQSQKMEAIGRLAGGVAHDFNNVMQVVMTCGECLDELLAGRPQELSYVREIRAAGERGAALTRQLLAFSRKQLVRPTLLDLNALVSDVQLLLRRMIGENLTLTTSLAREMCAIHADAGQMEQVLINLAINARDAMPDAGELFIGTSIVDATDAQRSAHSIQTTGRHVVLTIRDTGSGMDAQTMSKIFEPFFTTKEANKGSGLGLSTVYGIVTQSGGFIEVDSVPAQGSEFRVYLPAAQQLPAHAHRPPQSEKSPGGTESILLVEDEGSLLSLVSQVLRTHGYTVWEASSGRAGMALAERPGLRIDLLICDVILPDFSGPQVAQRLLKSHPDSKVLFVSGYTDDYISHAGVMQGATLLLEKPFGIGSILARVREALDAPAHPA